MPNRAATRYTWTAVRPPTPIAGLATRYYVANPNADIAMNVWRQGGSWRWGILAFVDGAMLVFRQGGAPTMHEGKLRAEAALPDGVHPPTLWEQLSKMPVSKNA